MQVKLRGVCCSHEAYLPLRRCASCPPVNQSLCQIVWKTKQNMFGFCLVNVDLQSQQSEFRLLWRATLRCSANLIHLRPYPPPIHSWGIGRSGMYWIYILYEESTVGLSHFIMRFTFVGQLKDFGNLPKLFPTWSTTWPLGVQKPSKIHTWEEAPSPWLIPWYHYFEFHDIISIFSFILFQSRTFCKKILPSCFVSTWKWNQTWLILDKVFWI